MTAKVILNPYAGRWLALKRKAEVELALKHANIDYELELTERPGHGIELASLSVDQGYSPIISAGGDGSVSEVVNGMVRAVETTGKELTIPFGVMPLGTANDFVNNLGLPKDLKTAAQVIASGKTKSLDLGHVSTTNPGESRYFDNNAAIGLEPYITLIQQRITRLRGTLRYLVATLIGIRDNPQWRMKLTWEGGEYQGPITLVTVGNSPRTGGLFYMTPKANPFDGMLTFVYGFMPTRLKILQLLPKTMKSGEGSYVEHPSIHQVNSPWLKVVTENATPAHADGEIIAEATKQVEYRVYPGKLQLITP